MCICCFIVVVFAVVIPLDVVKNEWEGPRGLGRRQLKTMGLHSNIFQDVYGAMFEPQGLMDISYSDVHHVTWGRVIEARHAQDPPTMMLPSQLYPLSPWGQFSRSSTLGCVRCVWFTWRGWVWLLTSGYYPSGMKISNEPKSEGVCVCVV